MSSFDEYFSTHFRIERDETITHIRQNTFGGRNLSETLLKSHLEEMWDEAFREGWKCAMPKDPRILGSDND